MGQFIDLSGQRFGSLTVLERVQSEKRQTLWRCVCDCGTSTVSQTGNLRSGASTSCGCKRIRHGHSCNRNQSRTYVAWRNMIRRCTELSNKDYKNYGGRGIRVCERWFVFDNFLADMGPAPANKTIDRIDNNGNYEPKNCRWATRLQQIHNRRR